MFEKTILLVEDDPNDEALVIHAIKKHKIRANISVAHDGIEALDFLENHKQTPPALVLLDLKMPRMDGLEVLRRLRQDERGQLLPVVVFTSSKQHEDVVKSYRLGASGYVTKPVDFNKFAEALQRIATYWLDLNEAPVRVARTDGVRP